MGTANDDLKEAFAGESQANRKYTAFARKADEEGLPGVAKLFRAAAEAETVHALAHLAAMDGVGDTTANLKAAIAGETYEFTEMYPGFIDDAKGESHQAAMLSFTRANSVEKEHASLYQAALDNHEKFAGVTFNVCQTCGHTVPGGAPDVCPVCGATKDQFKAVD